MPAWRVERNIYELEKQLAVQAERDQLDQLKADQKVADAKFAKYKAAIADEAALGQISATEQVRQEQDLLDVKWSYDQAYYEKKLDAAQNDVRNRQKIIEEQELAYEKYVGEVQALDTKLAEANKKAWDDLVAPVERAIDTSVTGISWARRRCRRRWRTLLSRLSQNSSTRRSRASSAKSAISLAPVSSEAAEIRTSRGVSPAPARKWRAAALLKV